MEALLNEARSMAADPIGTNVGELALEAGLELKAHGHPAASRSVLALGLLWFEERAARASLSTGERLMRARSYYEMGDYSAAALVADSLLAEKPLDPDYLGISARIGARTSDSTTFARSFAMLLDLPRKYSLGIPSFEAARAAAARDDTDRAIQQLSLAFDNGKEFDLWAHRDTDLMKLTANSRYRELVRHKR